MARETLFDDPRTLSIAAACNLDPDDAAGKLLRLWLWGGAHTTNGLVKGATFDSVDSFVGIKGFSEAMRVAGWLECAPESGVRFPRWTKYNAKCAKQRLLGARRAANKRARDVAEESRRRVTKSAPTEQNRTDREEEDIDLVIGGPSAPGIGWALLQRLAFDDGAIRAILATPGVDDCRIHWACAEWAAQQARARRGHRGKIKSPQAYVRKLITRKTEPAEYRAKWNGERLAKQAASVGVAGRVGVSA